jgi:hypothetical protein
MQWTWVILSGETVHRKDRAKERNQTLELVDVLTVEEQI